MLLKQQQTMYTVQVTYCDSAAPSSDLYCQHRPTQSQKHIHVWKCVWGFLIVEFFYSINRYLNYQHRINIDDCCIIKELWTLHFISCTYCLFVSNIWLVIVLYDHVFTVLWLVSYPDVIWWNDGSMGCVCVYIHACTYVCMYVRTYICMYVCMYVCMYMLNTLRCFNRSVQVHNITLMFKFVIDTFDGTSAH